MINGIFHGIEYELIFIFLKKITFTVIADRVGMIPRLALAATHRHEITLKHEDMRAFCVF